ncbi:MAG: M23 family metallopeptidase [Lentimicrobium sp.]|jgi:hypothetical protein|nr:M23 family metallopeptidase [Lentimicrobium sp.]
MKAFFLSILIIFNCGIVCSQKLYPQDYFRSPTDFALTLSGTFAELRPNHFHSGIDIKTGGVEGKPVYGCADGYVSRIKISPYGFGKALYVVHPNGYTTVYGHLSSFRSDIATYTNQHQYELESFEVDLFLKPGQLKIKKGEVFCYTGNSGSSMGPHLHFEIRDSNTEEPIDPLLFGMPVKDFVRPTLKGFRIYAEGESSVVNGRRGSAEPLLAGWGEDYHFRLGDTVTVAGGVSFGILAWDLLSGASNKNGINRLTVTIDSTIFFNFIAQRFSFSETRYLNALIDYAEYFKTGQRYIRTRKLPNSKLSLYDKVASEGIFYPDAGKTYKMKVELADGSDNISILKFNLRGEPVTEIFKQPLLNGQLFNYQTLNRFSTPHLRLTVPENCLYENIYFEYSAGDALKTTCAPIHAIHTANTPLHNFYELSIRVDSAWRTYKDKLTMVRLNSKNKPTSVGGTYEGGFLSGRVRDFGRYTVMADTVRPTIKPRNISDQKKLSAQSTIECTISDDLSGIKSHRATLNGQWILMEYDAKNSLLTYKFDHRLKSGENKFELVVMDGCLNTATYKATVLY